MTSELGGKRVLTEGDHSQHECDQRDNATEDFGPGFCYECARGPADGEIPVHSYVQQRQNGCTLQNHSHNRQTVTTTQQNTT